MQAFHGVGRINDLADGRIEGEERDHLLPCPPPGSGPEFTPRHCKAGFDALASSRGSPQANGYNEQPQGAGNASASARNLNSETSN